MHYEYVVTLKRDNEKQVNFISICLCFLSALAFIFEQVRTHHFNFFLSFAAFLLLTGIIMNWILSRKQKTVRYKTWLLIAGIFWIGMPYLQWLFLLFFVLAFLEYQAIYPLEIGFTHDRVVINSLIRKQFSWTDFNNIILKDGLLTLDFSNNKLFQKETIDDDEPDADEDEFNEYCRSKLANNS
jgi:hypothetical protein